MTTDDFFEESMGNSFGCVEGVGNLNDVLRFASLFDSRGKF